MTPLAASELDRRETAPCGSVGPIAGSAGPLPGATRRAPLLFQAFCSPPGAWPSARHLLVRPIVVRRGRASQASFQPCRSPPGQDPAFLSAHLPPFGLPSPPVGWAHRLSIVCELMLAHSGPHQGGARGGDARRGDAARRRRRRRRWSVREEGGELSGQRGGDGGGDGGGSGAGGGGCLRRRGWRRRRRRRPRR